MVEEAKLLLRKRTRSLWLLYFILATQRAYHGEAALMTFCNVTRRFHYFALILCPSFVFFFFFLLSERCSTCSEIWRGTPFSTAADVYSFGICMWEIGSRKLPFRDIDTLQLLEFAVLGGQRPGQDGLLREAIDDEVFVLLMNQCWAPTAESRPTFAMILSRLEAL